MVKFRVGAVDSLGQCLRKRKRRPVRRFILELRAVARRRCLQGVGVIKEVRYAMDKYSAEHYNTKVKDWKIHLDKGVCPFRMKGNDFICSHPDNERGICKYEDCPIT